MLESVRKHVAIPHLPAQVVYSAGALSSFLWLLAHDLVHPVVVYLLQVYLTF